MRPPDREVVIYRKHGRSISNNSVLDVLQGRGVDACFIEGGLTAWNGETAAEPSPEKS